MQVMLLEAFRLLSQDSVTVYPQPSNIIPSTTSHLTSSSPTVVVEPLLVQCMRLSRSPKSLTEYSYLPPNWKGALSRYKLLGCYRGDTADHNTYINHLNCTHIQPQTLSGWLTGRILILIFQQLTSSTLLTIRS